MVKRLITRWINLITFGRWATVGEILAAQDESVSELRQDLDATIYRLDELMRLLEKEINLVIPGHLEGPRLVASVERDAVVDSLPKPPEFPGAGA